MKKFLYLSLLLSPLAFGANPASGTNSTASPVSVPDQQAAAVATAPAPNNTINAAQGQLINQTIAIVNNGVITQSDLDAATAEAKMQIQQSGMAMPDDLSLQRQVLHQLILQKITMELADLNHITVSNSEVDQEIEGIASRNNLKSSQLKEVLQQQGVNYDSYWQDIHDHLVIRKLEQQAVANSIIITPDEVNNYLAAKAQLASPDTEYDVQHILLPLPGNPTAENLAKAKQQTQNIVDQINNGLAFTKAAVQYSQSDDALQGGDLGWKTADQLPSVFANIVQTMQVGQVLGPIQTDTGFHIVKLVNKRTPDQTQHFITEKHVRDILVKTSPIITDAKAEALLKDLRAQLVKGADFATLAKANSQDLSSMTNGGDMGWLSDAALSPQFAAVLNTTPVNGISAPFKTDAGWYLIQVLGTRQKDDTANYRKQQAQEYLFQQKVNQALDQWQNTILGDSYVQILVPNLVMPD